MEHESVRRRSGCATFFLALLALAAGGFAMWLWMVYRDPPFSTDPMVTGFQKMNELTVFRAQVMTVPTSHVDGMLDMFDREQTDILPARVRYTLDLARLTSRDVHWDAATDTLAVVVPPIAVQPAELDAASRRTFRTGPPATAATWDQFARSNVIKGRREAASLARAPELMRMAETSAREAVAANATLFLRGAGVTDAKVVVRFVTEGDSSAEHWDTTRTRAEVLANRH